MANAYVAFVCSIMYAGICMRETEPANMWLINLDLRVAFVCAIYLHCVCQIFVYVRESS